MKKKIIYPLLAGALILMSIVLLKGMTKKTDKTKPHERNVSLTVVNHSSISWTEIDITDNLNNTQVIFPSTLSSANYPTTDGNTIKIYFSSTFSTAIEVFDNDTNTLGCSPSGSGSTRTLTNVLGCSTSAEIDFYTGTYCP